MLFFRHLYIQISDLNMQIKFFILIVVLYILPQMAYSQDLDSLVNKLDSIKRQIDTVPQKNLIEPGFYNEKTIVTFKVFGI